MLWGRLLVLTGQHDRIAGWVDRAPEGVEQYSDYWFALGKSQLEQKNFPEAVNSLCRAVLLDETDHRAYRMLAAALKAIGNHEQAEDAVERADWIQQTVKLGDQMASSPQRDVRQIGVLIELLEKLRRPLEALGWRGIQVAYGHANSMLDESSAKCPSNDQSEACGRATKGRRCEKIFHHLWRRLATEVKLTFGNDAVQGFWLMSQ